jgi:serine/threonine protein phosphatase PrpC
MVVANVGDSRAVLCRKGKAMRLSHDDDPDDPDESSRIKKFGGKIVQNSQGVMQVRFTLAFFCLFVCS